MGDMNARTASLEEQPTDPSDDHQKNSIETANHTIPINTRRNCDNVINSHGKNIIEFCNTYNLKSLMVNQKAIPWAILHIMMKN